MAYKCGNSGDVIFKSTNMAVVSWEFTSEVVTDDAKSVATEGYSYEVGCGTNGSGSFEAIWDSDIHEGNPSDLVAGDSGAIELETVNDGSSYSGTAMIKSITTSHEVDKLMRVSVDFSMQGPFYTPGQTVS